MNMKSTRHTTDTLRRCFAALMETLSQESRGRSGCIRSVHTGFSVEDPFLLLSILTVIAKQNLHRTSSVCVSKASSEGLNESPKAANAVETTLTEFPVPARLTFFHSRLSAVLAMRTSAWSSLYSSGISPSSSRAFISGAQDCACVAARRSLGRWLRGSYSNITESLSWVMGRGGESRCGPH